MKKRNQRVFTQSDGIGNGGQGDNVKTHIKLLKVKRRHLEVFFAKTTKKEEKNEK